MIYFSYICLGMLFVLLAVCNDLCFFSKRNIRLYDPTHVMGHGPKRDYGFQIVPG